MDDSVELIPVIWFVSVGSTIKEDDSIVEVLVVKDKLKRFRDLDK